MALEIKTVADSISALVIPRVQIMDLNEIPTAVTTRADLSIMMPLPEFITEFDMVRDSFGGGSTAKMTVTYKLNYRFFLAEAGSYRNKKLDWMVDIVDRVAKVMDAILAIDVFAGCIDIVPGEISNMGVVNDPTEKDFYGCDITVEVKEFVN
jgi:hypothetical protein